MKCMESTESTGAGSTRTFQREVPLHTQPAEPPLVCSELKVGQFVDVRDKPGSMWTLAVITRTGRNAKQCRVSLVDTKRKVIPGSQGSQFSQMRHPKAEIHA